MVPHEKEQYGLDLLEGLMMNDPKRPESYLRLWQYYYRQSKYMARANSPEINNGFSSLSGISRTQKQSEIKKSIEIAARIVIFAVDVRESI